MTAWKWRQRSAAMGAALVLLPVSHACPQGESDTMTEALRAGRYGEAYESTVQREGKAGIPTAVARVARALLIVSMGSEDAYVRWFALRAAQPLAEPALAEGARQRARSGDRYDQSLALEILINTDAQGSREEFLAALDSPFRSVRLRAIRGLAKLKERTLAERFAEIVSSDPDPDLRAFAALALADTGAPEATTGLYRALDDPVAAVQEEAVRALVALNDHGIGGVIRRRLAEGPPETRVQTLRLAGLVPDRELVRELGRFLADGDPEIRAFAAGAILSIMERAEARKQ